VIPVAAFQCHLQHGNPTNAKLDGRPFKSQSIDARLRRFAGDRSEQLVEVIL
jgi:hypothetical protein